MTDIIDMTGKITMVTGANAGIGRATARGLAAAGATVILVARSQERGQEARDAIRGQTGNGEVHLMLADLSRQADIRELAAKFKEQYERLDVLVNNAGRVFDDRRLSDDGYEMTFALNHLGYFLLTNLLLDRLLASPEPRVVNLSSNAHRGAKLDFDDLMLENSYSTFDAYGKSKLANILFTKELDRRYGDQGLITNAVHPGFVGSNFGLNAGAIAAFFYKLIRPFIRSSEKGAETPLWLATAPEASRYRARYFFDKEPVAPSDAARDEDAARRLWQVSAGLTNLQEPIPA